MARAEQYREQLKLEIHSLLCTEKNPIPAIELNKNYRELMSCCIVWVRLGYKTLEELLQSMKDTVHCTYVNGQLMVSAVLREESVHISELVAGQKYVPKKNNKKNHQQYNKIPFALVNNNNNRQLGNGLLPVPSLGNLVATQYQSSFKGNSHSYNVNRLPQRPMMPNRESNSQAWVNQPQQQTIQDQIPVAHAQGPHMTQHSQSLEQNIHKQTSEGISHVSQQLNSESSNHSNRPPSALGEPQSTEEPVAQSTSSRPKPGVDIARLRRLMAKKLVVSQATCTEPNYQRDEQTQTTETLQTLSRLERSPTTDKHVQCPEPELAPRFDLHSRASTEHSVSLPPLSYSASPSVSVTSQLTSFSRMGDTTFVRVVPPVLPSLNKSQSSINTPVNNVPTFFKKENEDVFYLEQLQDMSKSGAIGRVSLRHLRLANGRYRAFIDVDGMQFSTQPTDFVQYTDAYEEAARRACLHFESRQ